jgi:hypothetical protein
MAYEMDKIGGFQNMKGILEFNLEDPDEDFEFQMAARAMDLRNTLLAIDDIARKISEAGSNPAQALVVIRKIISDLDIEPDRANKEDIY